MSANDLSQDVKDFIFQYIDSVEQLEVFLLLSSDPNKIWSSAEISATLRSNSNSVEKRLNQLLVHQLVEVIATPESRYRLNQKNENVQKMILQLSDAYKMHRHNILQMIFSPMKKSRDFAEAFRIGSSKDPKGGDNA